MEKATGTVASGRTHGLVALAALGAGTLWAVVEGWPVQQVAIGLLCGLIMTPDLDVDHATVEELRLGRIPLIGKPLSIAWMTLWYPYALAIGHRSPLSHWPGIGTVGRVAYLAVWARLALNALGAEAGLLARTFWSPVWLWALGAWGAQDALHWLWDYAPVLRRL